MGNKEAWTDNLDKKIIESEKKESTDKNKVNTVDYNAKYDEILRKRLWARVGIVGVSLLILIVAMMLAVKSTTIPEDKLISSVGELVEVSTFTDKLEYYPSNISTKLNGYIAELNIDVSDTIVNGYMSLGNYSYLGYTNEDQSVYTEIVISDTIPDEIGLTDESVEKLSRANEIVYETTEDKEYDKAINKAAVNLYGIGYLFVVQQTDPDNADYMFEDTMIETIMDTMLYEKVSENDIIDNKLYITFDSFGTFNLYDLDTKFDSLGLYTDETGTLRVYDVTSDKDIFIITSINNDFIGAYTSDENLVQKDGWNNVYETLDYTDSNSDGYRGFAIQTVRGMYFIQVAKDAPEGLEDDIINLLGVLPDDDYIKPVFVEEETTSE